MVQKTPLTMMAELVLLEYITNGAGSSEREGLVIIRISRFMFLRTDLMKLCIELRPHLDRENKTDSVKAQ